MKSAKCRICQQDDCSCASQLSDQLVVTVSCTICDKLLQFCDCGGSRHQWKRDTEHLQEVSDLFGIRR